MSRRRIRKELVSHLLEYEYFIEKASSLMVGFVLLLIVIVVPNWPITFKKYGAGPTSIALRDIGLSMFITMLLLMAGFTAILVPHFEPYLRPKGFRTLKDKRTLNMYLALITGLLSVVVLAYLIYAVTMFLY